MIPFRRTASRPRFLFALREHSPLLRIGLVTTACYGALAVYYGSGLPGGAWQTAFSTIIVLLLFYLFCRGWLALGRGGDKQTLVIGFAIIFALLGLLFPAFHSTDLYSYVNLGWTQIRYRLNPYVHPPGDVPDLQHDPMITPVWLYDPSPYGFLFSHLTQGIVFIGHGHLRAMLLMFQIVNLISCGFVAWMVVATRNLLPVREDDSVLYLLLWNPLIILQLIADAHNDALMALFMMLAIYAAVRERWLLVIPLLTMGALIKYSTAVVIPFAVIEMICRRRFGALALGGALAMTLFLWSAALYLPDYRHFQTSAIASNLFSTANSFESVFYYPIEMLLKPIPELRGALPALHKVLVGLIAAFGFAVLFAQLIRYGQRWSGSLNDFLANALFAQLLLSCVLATKFHPWYIGAFFPLALLLEDDHWLRKLTILLSLTGLLDFTPLGQAHIINYLLMVGAPAWWVIHSKWRSQQSKGISWITFKKFGT
jgi:alpha-1,6-mannosyltransferase